MILIWMMLILQCKMKLRTFFNHEINWTIYRNLVTTLTSVTCSLINTYDGATNATHSPAH